MYSSQGLFKGYAILVCALSLFIGACKKEEIPGPKGDPGTPGIGGNANITSSSVFSVTSSQWLEDTVAMCRKATLDFPQITNEVITKGAVKVFIQTDAVYLNPAWTELPFVQGDLFTQFGFDAGHLYLDYINIEGGIPAAPATRNYRLVIYSEL